jgi:hypothetical protein
MSKNKLPSGVPKHWYLCALHIGYVLKDRDDPLKTIGSSTITTNVIVTPTSKRITQATLEDIRQLGLVKMRDIFNVDPKHTTDVAIMNIAYLGLMSEEQFFDTKKGAPKT